MTMAWNSLSFALHDNRGSW